MLIIGHRGAPRHAPENTIQSFDAALELEVDMIELDVRITRDGHPVAIHDATLTRTHRISSHIHALTLDELQRAARDKPIPTLREVLDRYFGRIMINVELKGRAAALPVLRLIEEHYIKRATDWDDILISSLRVRELIMLRKHSDKVNIALVHRENPFIFVAYTRRLNLTGVVFHRLHLNRFALEIAKKSRLFTAVYTVNRPQAARLLRTAGYDAIFTNCPDKMNDL